MMDKKTYDLIREREFIGRKVKTLVELNNGWCRIAPGTIATVQRKYNGLGLMTEPCPTCGVRIHISRVRPREVDFVDQESML